MNWEEDNEEREYLRRRTLKALRVYFARDRRPRLIMGAILLATGTAGLVASFVMLKLGMYQMWLRYPLALFVAWGVLLLLVRGWAEVERHSFRFEGQMATLLKGRDPAETRDQLRERDWSGLKGFNPFEVLTTDADGCLAGIIVLVCAVVSVCAIGAIVGIIAAAPFLIAEVFLDAVLVTALYGKLRGLDRRSWLNGAVRHTLGPALWAAVALLVAGAAFQVIAPEAKSIRGVWHHWRHGRPPVEVEKV